MKLPKKIMAMGLAGLLAFSACGPKVEHAKLGEVNYQQEAVIHTYSKEDPYKPGLMVRILDLDGKHDANGKVTADEAFIYEGDPGLLPNLVRDMMFIPVHRVKHYVAPDAKNPIVLNNITPMTPEQRDFYSKILNMYHENVVRQE
ncbi:hypothetical protein JXB28_00250 [Candidatus Woesearchaeota archaeon]|nr:hypothetical protein [Candidatus Woesearchaeota archaeon]